MHSQINQVNKECNRRRKQKRVDCEVGGRGPRARKRLFALSFSPSRLFAKTQTTLMLQPLPHAPVYVARSVSYFIYLQVRVGDITWACLVQRGIVSGRAVEAWPVRRIGPSLYPLPRGLVRYFASSSAVCHLSAHVL